MTRSVAEIIRRLEELHVEQSNLIEELTRANETKAQRVPPTTQKTPTFEIGNRVQIINAKPRSLTSDLNKLEEYGVMTRITSSCVHIRTDYGMIVQRAPTNVRQSTRNKTTKKKT